MYNGKRTRAAFRIYRTRPLAVLIDLDAPPGEYAYMDNEGNFDTAPIEWFRMLRPATLGQSEPLIEMLESQGIHVEFVARVA